MAEKKPTPVPATKKDDPEDVSWALSTAEAMWNRGDQVDAVKWIRRAAEAASETEDDDRALELAKAAADLATLVGPIPQTAPPPPVVARVSAPPPRPSAMPPPPPSRPTPSPASRPTAPPPLPPSNKSLPTAPLTSATPPRAPAPARVTASAQPRATTTAKGTAPMIPAVRPAAGVPAALAKTTTRRKSSANLTEEAKRAVLNEVTIRAAENEVTQMVQVPEPRRRGRSKPAPEEIAPPAPPPPIVHEPVSTTTDEMDSWPTQSLSGDDDFDDDKERTRIGAPAYQETVLRASERPPAAPVQPELSSTQAIRVVVWRAADGVHVAPYGTTVNAIGVDAMLVALDPAADLTAWLTKA